jgi:hypothetical protein
MNKTIFALAIGVIALGMTGCNEEAQAKMKKPAIINIGMIDGCEVKWVDRGYKEYSFYVAHCNTTTVTTSGYETGGKSSEHIPVAVIVDEQKMEATREALAMQKELEEMRARDSALAKLTPAEKAALGITIK